MTEKRPYKNTTTGKLEPGAVIEDGRRIDRKQFKGKPKSFGRKRREDLDAHREKTPVTEGQGKRARANGERRLRALARAAAQQKK